MNPTLISGNERDTGDMSTEPGTTPGEQQVEHRLPEDDAEKLGNFA